VLARYAFDPFGARTPLYGNPGATRHGFTGHEELPEVGLIHMNGRVYDPVLGRFLSADPQIQFPDNLQSYNRYSYVMNNPLVYTDPSGFGLFGSIGKFFSNLWNNDIFRTAVSIAAAFVLTTVFPPFGGFAFGNAMLGGFVGGYLQTGTLQGGMLGALSAGLFYGAGSINQGLNLSMGGRVLTHAIAGCVSAEASGGKCGQGALSAGFAEAAGPFTQGLGQTGDLVAHSVVGGTASVLGGGKFENGAMTGAYGYLFNECMHSSGCVKALRGGKVESSGWQDPNNHRIGAGARVVIRDESGERFMYGHLDPDHLPTVGTHLNIDDEIANIGVPTNGHSSGPHVHVQHWDSNMRIVNPGTISPVNGAVLTTAFGVRDSMHPYAHQGNDYAIPNR